jgi:hypothetical protein
MASKRSVKEATSSSGGPPSKKKSPAKNHGIIFKDNKQKDMYKALISKLLHPWRYPDSHTLNVLKIRDNVFGLLNRLGWVEMLRPMKGFENITYEFY